MFARRIVQRLTRAVRIPVGRLLLLAAWLALAQPPAPVRAEAGPGAAAASYIGQASCRSCHPVEADHWSPTLHARLLGRPRGELQRLGCEGCHGPGSRHMTDPSNPDSIVAFTRQSETPIQTMNEMCLACHDGGPRIYWAGSTHERQNLACSDCHNPMSQQSARGLMARRSISETCFSCHPQQRSQFRKRSHMPLLEGKIACSGCHEPHGSATDPLLRGDSVNQMCNSCHAEKRGPFLWEHAPVVESCLTCHRPHGSNHEGLLVAPSPFLCNQCHAQMGGFSHPNDLLARGNLAVGFRPDERILGRGCVNCHAQIHGSNHPSGARFHR